MAQLLCLYLSSPYCQENSSRVTCHEYTAGGVLGTVIGFIQRLAGSFTAVVIQANFIHINYQVNGFLRHLGIGRYHITQ